MRRLILVIKLGCPKVSIVITNWNGKDDTIECIESLQKLYYPNSEIIVVDNGSTDGSQVKIREQYPSIKLIQNNKNLGFARGNNIGIKHALEHGADYILLLNNDTVVCPRAIEELIDVSNRDETAGILGPKVLYYDQPTRIWSAGGRIDFRTGTAPNLGYKEVDDGFDHIKDVDYISGCALFVKAKVLEKIGLFDEKYFIFYEDADLCLHAKRAGFRIIFVPKARIFHKGGRATGGDISPFREYYYTRNKILFMRKNAEIQDFLVFLIYLSINLLIKSTIYVISGKFKLLIALFKGVLWNLTHSVG